VTLHF
jgi:hypothetical protein